MVCFHNQDSSHTHPAQIKIPPNNVYVCLRSQFVYIYTLEGEHAIQTDLFVEPSFHSRNISREITEKQVSKLTHTFLV